MKFITLLFLSSIYVHAATASTVECGAFRGKSTGSGSSQFQRRDQNSAETGYMKLIEGVTVKAFVTRVMTPHGPIDEEVMGLDVNSDEESGRQKLESFTTSDNAHNTIDTSYAGYIDGKFTVIVCAIKDVRP